MRLLAMSLLMILAGCDAGPPPDTTYATSGRPAASASAEAPSPAPGTAAPDTVDAALVLPGDFAESTTVGDLQAMFGAHEVLVEDAPQDGGGVRRRVVLFPDDPARRAYVEFHDPDAMAGIASISVRDAGSVWRGKNGVRIGMSFAELRQANGRPFGYWGFDGDGRAWVRDQWSAGDDGGLGTLDVGEDDHMYFGVDLGFRGGVGAVPADAFPHEESMSSDDPRFPGLAGSVEVVALVASTSLDDEWE